MDAKRVARFRGLRRTLFRNAFVTAGTLILVLVVLTGTLGPMLSHYNPIKSSLRERLQPPGWTHLMGTDGFGRDVLTRNVYAARVSLQLSFAIVALTTVAASLVGVSVAWFRRLDNPVMRLMDVMMSLPSLILAIALMGFLGAKQTNLVIAIFVTQLPRMVRVVRAAAIAIRENEYLDAARSLGCSDARIMARYILPNALSPIVVQATFLFAQVILIESALSFIGVGTPPPTPSVAGAGPPFSLGQEGTPFRRAP
jgi:peptide/nickel transport system permease protein